MKSAVQIQPISDGGRLPLEEIEAFVAVALAGSFTAAAERLLISHSSLSRKVQHLEQLLGAKLFERRAHGVQLTIAGTDHFQKFRDALDIVSGAMRDRARADQSIVRISILQSFATTWLFPRYPRMQERIAGLQVRYVFDKRPTDFRDGIDLAVRFGEGNWPNVRAIPLWESTLRPMAGRSIALRIGVEASPAQMLAFPLLNLGSTFSWKHWLSNHGIDYELRPFDHVFDETATILSACEHGLGVALGRTETRAFVDGQRLAYVSPEAIPVARQYFLIRDELRPLRRAAHDYAEALLIASDVPAPSIHRFLQ